MAGPAFISGVQGYVPGWFRDKRLFDLEDLKDYQVVVERLKKVIYCFILLNNINAFLSQSI
jgi:hypothetical protein